MRTIIVDDEPLMLQSFCRTSNGISDIDIQGIFTNPNQALDFCRTNQVDLAVLDVCMPLMSGIELAEKLRANRPDILIVFATAYESYIREANLIGADDYILKPYTRPVIEKMTQKLKLLSLRQRKDIFVRTFGRFQVLVRDVPIQISGKAKEILAYLVTMHGREASNEQIYTAMWEGRPYSNIDMKVYYNALRRLRDTLAENKLQDLLISSTRGQSINIQMFDCDLYQWQELHADDETAQGNDFLTEYAWSGRLLAEQEKHPEK